MKKRHLLLLPAMLLLIAALLQLLPASPGGVGAYVSSETQLFRTPDSPEPFAAIPGGARVLWLSTTEDCAHGYIETELDGIAVRAYVPWLSLNIPNDGTEQEQAMTCLRTVLGWTEEEIAEYRMHTPAIYMRNQFVSVGVVSGTHPGWTYYIWLDLLSGGLHDIQTPFSGEKQLADEKTIRATLRSGRLADAEAVRAYFVNCYGPEESWSPALTEWATLEMGKYP